MFRILASLTLALSFHSLASGQVRPLEIEPVETVRKGYIRAEVGVEFLQGTVFRLSGLEGDLTRLGVAKLRMGLGEIVEVQMAGVAHNFLSIDRRFPAPNSDNLSFDGNSTRDFGDLVVATKVRLLPERNGWPALGARFATQLPNASNKKGIGTDEMSFLNSLLVEKSLGDARLVGNFGLLILGDPVEGGAQDDLFAYGLGLFVPVHPQIHLAGELFGRAGPGGIGTEESAVVRVGVQIEGAGMRWDAGALIGLRSTDPNSGFSFGVSKEFRNPFFAF